MSLLLSEGMAVKSRMKPDERHVLQHIPGYPDKKVGQGHALLKRCFLSKSSTFTDPKMPHSQIDQAYWSKFDMATVEEEVNESPICEKCLGYMATLAEELSIGLTEDTSLPEWCQTCFEVYRDRTQKTWALDRDVSDAIFKSQQTFMRRLAAKLTDHQVSLYLDFDDEEAQQVRRGLKGDAWENAMSAILARRVKSAETFLAWVGSGDKYCMGERAAAIEIGKDITMFSFPALGDTRNLLPAGSVPDSLSDICKRDRHGTAFAEKVCDECGGVHCSNICHRAKMGV